jgi:hypothetical protein
VAITPTIEQCASIVEARACLHATWWDDPHLGDSVGAWSDAEATQCYLQNLAEQVTRFADRLGENLPRERRELYERLLLDRYHAALASHGVDGYDRHALDDDYRMSMLWQITTPVWQSAYNIPPVIW